MSGEATAELATPLPFPGGRRRPRRRMLLAGAVVVCVIAGVVVGTTNPFAGSGSSRAGTALASTGATQTVTQRSLSQQTQVDATLGYAGDYDVVNQLGAGTGSAGAGGSPAGAQTTADVSDAPDGAPPAMLTAYFDDPSTTSTSTSTSATTPSTTTTTAPATTTTTVPSATTTTTPRRAGPPSTPPQTSAAAPQGGGSQRQPGGNGMSGSSGSNQSRPSNPPGTGTGSSSSASQPPNVVTALPAVGQVVSQGQRLYSVNGTPVVLLYGSTPAYRTLSEGETGADVAELNADLVALGDASTSQLDPTSDTFSAATAAALDQLQASLGVTQTGSLALGQAVFLPTAARVTTVSASLGAPLNYGAQVLQATSTSRQVQVALDAAQQTDVAVGDKVTITLPNNQTTAGVVSSVGTVATCPSGSGSSSSSSSSSSGSSSGSSGTDSCPSSSSSSSGSTTTPTITVDIAPTDPKATGTWDQAPVQVTITTASVANALVVPVAALLAQASGGYAVEVQGAGGINRLVPVSLGLFDDADGLVQVTGAGLAAGQKVVVPST